MDHERRRWPQQARRARMLLVSVAAWGAVYVIYASGSYAQISPDFFAQMHAALQARVAGNPDDATGWRLLGKLRVQTGDLGGAREALERAVRLDPDSAAAAFQLAEVLMRCQQQAAAAAQLRRVCELAPDSDYARSAQSFLLQLGPADQSAVIPAGYEIKRFDQTGAPPPIARSPEQRTAGDSSLSLLNASLESGVLF